MPDRVYHIHDGDALPPSYERVVRSLSEADLEDELLSERGDPEYRAALVAEHERRAGQGSPVSS